MKKFEYFCLMVIMVILVPGWNAIAQNSIDSAKIIASPQTREAIRSGKITEKEIEEGVQAIEKGKLPPEELKAYQEKAYNGTLTPSEIEAAKKLYERNKKESRAEGKDVVFLFGNVLNPGEYQYEAGMRVSDVIPSLEALKEDTFFQYALIKRYEVFDGEKPEEDKKAGAPEEKEVIEAGEEMDAAKEKEEKKKGKPFYVVTEDGVQVELITFDLGRLMFSEDQTQNFLLRPRDEIYIFNKKEERKEEISEKEKFFDKELPEEEIKLEDLEIFGRSLFSERTAGLEPVLSIPVSLDYIIGPDDEIKILIWGRMNASHELVVDREGFLHIPKIGTFSVAGLTFGELKEVIRKKISATTGVEVNISMGRLKTIQVFALGEVENPGLYTLSPQASVFHVLLASGGPTKLGSLRNIQLKRNGHVVSSIDLYDYLLSGEIATNAGLRQEDVIFVPQAGIRVSILGNVKRPAIYELGINDKLSDAIALAGGLSPVASDQRIQIERADKNTSKVFLDVAYKDLQTRKSVSLRDGDIIRVFPIIPTPENTVYLYGNVKQPGTFEFKTGLRLSDILPDMNGFNDDTFFDYALIKRYHPGKIKAELIPFNLGKLVFQKDESQNLALAGRDEVYIFSKDKFIETPSAMVEGQVRNPGRYEIEDMSIRDLILKAGGLTNDAYLQKAELIRFDEQRNRHTIYFSVSKVMAGDSEANQKIRDDDWVIIHSVREEHLEKYVSVNGEVKKTGRYLLSSGMRLADLIFKAGGFTRDAYMKIGHLYRTDAVSRDIRILRFNLEKAMAKDPVENILLSDMDEVYIHNVWEFKEKYTVSIKGLVLNPGDYPYATNMTVRDLILVAGNVRDAAFMDEAELVRFSIVDGRKVETSIIQFNIRLAQQNHPDHNLKLQPLDVVTIKEIPAWWEKKKEITISGEVYFPGTYQIRKEERLSDVIRRAGGFTEYAYLQGAVFTRESVREVQQARIDKMMEELETNIARMSSEELQKSLSSEDLAAQTQFMTSQKVLLEKLKKTKATGRVVITLTPLDQFTEQSSNLVLENGDTLDIPKKPHTVNVIGAVYNPTAIIHDRTRPELQYYLDQTGGPTENADEDLMYIIRANGTVVSKMSERSWWKKFENTHLEPGDTVLVPEKVIVTSYMRDVKDITEILWKIAMTAGITATQILQ